MKINIRNMMESDRMVVVDMMRAFYHSPAVWTDGSEEIYNNDVTACVGDSPYAEGFIFENHIEIIGYGMIAKSFSTEFGKPCIWIEDLYFKPEFRGKGLGGEFFAYLDEKYPGTIMRLEAEEENERAIHVYKKCGFDVLPYMELKKIN